MKASASSSPKRDEAKWAAFEFAEAACSRIFIGQLGQTPLSVSPNQTAEWIEREANALADLKASEQENLDTFVGRGGRYADTGAIHILQRRLQFWNELQEIWPRITASDDTGREYVALRNGETVEWIELVRLLSEGQFKREAV